MPQIINTNIMSMNSQRNLNMSQSALQTSLQRLSSGLRINSAKDDAAGLAISERFTTQIRGLNQAVRNANDGISLSQTAEGALAEMNNNLQRIRELAVQSANATNSASDRAALDQEVQQRLAEIERIGVSTSFNGQKILDGTFGTANFQVGANVGETIGLDLSTSMRTADIGAVATATSTVDLTTLMNPSGTAGRYESGTIASFDFATIAGTPYQTISLGAFTEGVDDGDGLNIYQFDLFDGVNPILEIIVNDVDTSASPTAVADALAAEFVAQGFGADGSGSVFGYSLDLGGAATIADAITNGTLSAQRIDNTEFYAINVGDGGYSTPPDFAGADNGGPTTPSTLVALPDTSNNKSITVDGGAAITLSGNTEADAVQQLQAALNIQASGSYLVSGDGAGKITIANTAVGVTSTAPVIAGPDAALFTTGGTATDGTGSGGTVTVSDDFAIQLGDGAAVNVANGIYTTPQQLVDALNTALAGNATALLNSDGTLSIHAMEDITISGATALTTLGLPASATAGGSLETVNVLDLTAANDAIFRIDSALTAVSSLRSTFGAIQNRFESTIANLSTTVENLTSSRSRIQDADFAAETAELTRAQILQQAGVAMLAQANQIPQNVMSLLR